MRAAGAVPPAHPMDLPLSRHALAAALLAASLSIAPAALPTSPRPADEEERNDRKAPGRPRDDGEGRLRTERRGIEESPPPVVVEERLDLEVFDSPGCSLRKEKRFVRALLAKKNPGQVLSLEVWGDTREYHPGDLVLFFARVPLRSHVSLFWIGPNGDMFVPFTNLAIPPNRDVRIDVGGVVVPPLGRERWVALATLEPVPFDCADPEAEHVAWLKSLSALPHAVGRWEVVSRPHGSR